MKVYGSEPDEVQRALRAGEITVAVYGLGKMGLPLAAVFADCGALVIGADINEDVVNSVNAGLCHVEGEPGLAEMIEKNKNRIRATTDLREAAHRADVMVIIVPTFLDEENNPDLSIVESVCMDIAYGLEPGDLVIQESTVPPGTTDTLIKNILEESGLAAGADFGIAHCPERTMSGRAIEDITGAYLKIVGGIDQESTRSAEAIYSLINRRGVITVSDARTAEAVKVFEGIYRDVNIALANELAMACRELGIDAIETCEVANTQPYCHIHKPGCGVGGHCIPVYPYFITRTLNTGFPLISLARNVNDAMAQYTVDLAEDALQEAGRQIQESNVLVMGLTYRGDVKETRKSPAYPIIRILRERGAHVYAYDPLVEETDGAIPATPQEVVDLDCIVFASDHQEFKNINWDDIGRRMRSRVVIDGRQTVNPMALRAKGFICESIGH